MVGTKKNRFIVKAPEHKKMKNKKKTKIKGLSSE